MLATDNVVPFVSDELRRRVRRRLPRIWSTTSAPSLASGPDQLVSTSTSDKEGATIATDWLSEERLPRLTRTSTSTPQTASSFTVPPTGPARLVAGCGLRDPRCRPCDRRDRPGPTFTRNVLSTTSVQSVTMPDGPKLRWTKPSGPTTKGASRQLRSSSRRAGRVPPVVNPPASTSTRSSTTERASPPSFPSASRSSGTSDQPCVQLLPRAPHRSWPNSTRRPSELQSQRPCHGTADPAVRYQRYTETRFWTIWSTLEPAWQDSALADRHGKLIGHSNHRFLAADRGSSTSQAPTPPDRRPFLYSHRNHMVATSPARTAAGRRHRLPRLPQIMRATGALGRFGSRALAQTPPTLHRFHSLTDRALQHYKHSSLAWVLSGPTSGAFKRRRRSREICTISARSRIAVAAIRDIVT